MLPPSPNALARAQLARDLPDLAKIETERMRRSLYRFLVGAWPTLEHATPLAPGWHLEYVAAHLQAVVMREPGSPVPCNLVVNIPPGTMKSLLTSVVLPAWVWLRNPSWRSIYASANPRVSLRDSMRCRDLVESEWYRDTFDVKWTLADDQNAKSQFKTSAGGSRLAIGVGAKITGDRADALFIDDPHDAAEVYSKVQREGVLYWYDNAFANRVNSPSDSTRVLIMQRLNSADLTGHVLEQGWSHICLPMEYEGDKRETFLGRVDPRTVEGELLMPTRFPREVVEAEKKRLGTAGSAGQLQQRPVPASGNRFKREWWRFYSPSPVGAVPMRPMGCSEVPARLRPQVFDRYIGSWDMAFKDTDGSDYVVGLTVGCVGAERYVLAMNRARMGFGASQAAVIQQRRDWPLCYEVLIEDKANGSAVIETLSRDITGIVAVNPEGGKESRAAILEPQVEAGNWFLPEGAEWLGDWLEEFASFPLGRNDDIVDSASQIAVRLNQNSDAAYAAMLLGIRL